MVLRSSYRGTETIVGLNQYTPFVDLALGNNLGHAVRLKPRGDRRHLAKDITEDPRALALF